MSTGAQNIIEVSASRYVIFRGIEFTGGSHGIRLMDSDFVTIEECEIHETGDVAMSANSGGTYEGLRILRNHIHHTHGTGEGMYLGCNSNGCRVANSLIEGNYIHHTNGADVDQGDGIEIKEGSYGNVVRDNVIHDTNYPGIITYSTVGNGPPNVLEGNVIWNSNDNAIQSAADVIMRNNIVLGNIALQSHQARQPGQHPDRAQHDHQQRRGHRSAQRRRPGAHREQRRLFRGHLCDPPRQRQSRPRDCRRQRRPRRIVGRQLRLHRGQGYRRGLRRCALRRSADRRVPEERLRADRRGQRSARNVDRLQRHFAHWHERRRRLSIQRVGQPGLDDQRWLQDQRHHRSADATDERHGDSHSCPKVAPRRVSARAAVCQYRGPGSYPHGARRCRCPGFT